MRTALWLTMLLGWLPEAHSQATHGVEQYYMKNGKTYNMIPVVYNETNSGFYTEVRYNYEDLNTFSFSAGKTFSKEAVISYTATPVAGVLAGQLDGVFAGINGEVKYKKLFFTTQSQYIFSTRGKSGDFLYGWSQFGYHTLTNFDAGLVLEQTKFYNEKGSIQLGLFVQARLKKWSFPFYIFKPESCERSFQLGLTCEWMSKKKNN